METGSATGTFAGVDVALTPLVGRRAETARIARLLSGARLVTLSGTGGVGKTRLALRVAAGAARSAFPDGVYVAELADLRDPELLAPSVLGTLDAANPGRPGADATAVLAARLRERRALLVLDNCEHLLDACARLTDTLLRDAPGLRVLATSRQPLGIAGEQVFPVEPLPVPDANADAGVGQGNGLRVLSGNPAVALFTDRAAAVLPGFTLTSADAAAVAELVRRLDGLPFAIELAAARIRSLTPQEILERLTDRFALLTGGSSVATDRQRTLRALIDWSHDLCTARERLLWARASVFRGGFDLEGLEQVCADAELPPAALLDTLDGLVARSIVNCRQVNGRSRYHMLETVREYGHERLAASGSLDALRGRHRDRYAELTARAGREWFGPRQVDWFTRLRLDHPNLRAALEFCLERPGQARAGLALAVSPRHYWITAGLLPEGCHWLSQLLATDRAQDEGDDDAGTDAAVRVQALVTETYLRILRGDPEDEVRRALAACEAAARRGGHRRESAWVRHHHGILAVWREDFASAAELFARAHSEFRALGCLDAALECRVKFAIANAYGGQAAVADEACREVEEAARAHDESWLRGMALLARALLALRADAPADAITHARAAIARLRPFQDWWDVAMCVEVIAWSTRDDPRRTARLLGVLHLLWESLGGRLGAAPFMRARHLRFDAAAREALSAAAFDREFRRGARATVDEAMAYVLEDAAGVPGLTRRESQIAELVAEGLTNKDIAARLTIAQRTAENHVERILDKLGFASRTQLAVWTYEQRDEPAGSRRRPGPTERAPADRRAEP